MKNIQNFNNMNAEQLMKMNGGGFAYDIGRIIRFIGIAGPNGMYTEVAIIDWQFNAG